MQPALIIAEFDCVLLVKGINFYERSAITKFVRCLFRAMFVTQYAFSLTILLTQLRLNAESIFTMINIWFEATLLLMYLYLVLRQRKFKRLYEDMLALCSQRDKDIRRMMRILCACSVLYFIVFVVAKLVAWYGIGTVAFLRGEFNMVIATATLRHQALSALCAVYFGLFSWSAISAMVYLIYVYLIKLMNESFFAQASVMIQSAKKRNFHHLRLYWLEIGKQKDRFERYGNFFPFFWFANTFMKCTGAVVASKVGNVTAGPWIVAANWISYSVDMAVELSALAFIDHSERAIKQLADDFSFELIKAMPLNNDDGQADKLLREIERDADLRLTGWAFFDLKRSLVLSLIGAAIPFTVLFVQLIDTSSSSASAAPR